MDLVLCSGRTDGFVRNFARLIETRLPVVSLNGALIRSAEGTTLFEAPLPMEAGHLVLETVKRHPETAVTLLTPDGALSTSVPPRLPRYLAAWPEEHRRIDDALMYIDRASMIVVKGRYTPVQEISVAIAQQSRGMVERILYRSKSGADEYYLELKRWGVHKGSAIRFLAGHLGVPVARFGAIGDYANDIEMCKTAGFAAAMRNAMDDLKQHADMVTLQTNNEDGVAEFLDAIRIAQSGGA